MNITDFYKASQERYSCSYFKQNEYPKKELIHKRLQCVVHKYVRLSGTLVGIETSVILFRHPMKVMPIRSVIRSRGTLRFSFPIPYMNPFL